jgi:putative intracellular protease/amidase
MRKSSKGGASSATNAVAERAPVTTGWGAWLFGGHASRKRRTGRTSYSPAEVRTESLEERRVLSASPLPVLMVIADRQDFYYQEYGDTRASLEAAGVSVRVAATTTNPSTPHAGTGQGASSGVVTPDVRIADARAEDYSAIVFVGGWGSSMYQYAFPGDYVNDRYDGDAATQLATNNLINDFVDQDKFVTAICHGVTVLAWARVDGTAASPLAGRQVSVPFIGSPAVNYQGQNYGHFQLGQRPQVVQNGGIANTVSGQYGNPNTVADDVIVDGRIITAENYDAAAEFGRVVAREVIAAATPVVIPNRAPNIAATAFTVPENSAAGTSFGVVSASDPDLGQSHTYAITGGSGAGLFAINPATGVLSVAAGANLDFETRADYDLVVTVTDSGTPALSASATMAISITDVVETPPSGIRREGNDLVARGTDAADTFYVWSDAGGRAYAWMNGTQSGPHTLPAGGRVRVFAGGGNDRIFATDAAIPVTIFGEAGHDQITGGSQGDILDGGDGVDRIWGMAGDDLLLGGAGDDFLDGREGNDVVVGGDGNDVISGQGGRDILIGGLGADRVDGGDGEDLLIGGTTDFDAHTNALLAFLEEWRQPTSTTQRLTNLSNGVSGGVSLRKNQTVRDDGAKDILNGGSDVDALFALGDDYLGNPAPWDMVV